MLISKEYQFIFIHVPKVAGQSITRALAPFATGRWQGKINLALSSKTFISKSFLNKIGLFHPHITAEELINIIGQQKFNSYFSFGIVRNPWEWQVSVYNYNLKNPNNNNHDLIKSLGSFENYLKWLSRQENNFFQKKYLFSQNGQQLVDYIGRYETLNEDFQFICDKIGIDAKLPRKNVYTTNDYKSYYHSQEMIDIVRQIFAVDIETFGYTF